MAEKTNFVEVHKGSYYDSDFDSELEEDEHKLLSKKKHTRYNVDDELSLSSKKKRKQGGLPKKKEVEVEYNKEQSRTQRFHIVSMDAYARHKKFINDYLTYYGGSRSEFKRDTSKDKTDLDVIRANHKFLWTEEDSDDSWEKRLAKKYYDKLFKEYCIIDLSRYKENKIALRWQMEKEVIGGKGQFICGNKKCEEKEGLKSWEVNFGYMEHGEKKNALVKVRLCPGECSYKLNYHHQRKEIKKKKHGKQKNSKETIVGEKDHDSIIEKSGEKSKSDISAEVDNSVWNKPAKTVVEKNRDEEFEEYFEDMFL